MKQIRNGGERNATNVIKYISNAAMIAKSNKSGWKLNVKIRLAPEDRSQWLNPC